MKGNLTKGILKKGKKIVTLALSMAMVVSSINVVPVNAEPNSTIPAVKLKIEAPAAGNTVNYDVEQIGDSFDTGTYKVDKDIRYWYVKKDESVETKFGPQFEADNNWQELDKDEEVKYQNDKTYCMQLKLASSDFEHYKFSNDVTKYSCNGNGKLIDLSMNEKGTIAYLVFEFKCKEALENVDIIVGKPEEGKTPADTKVKEIKTTPEGALKDDSFVSEIDLSDKWLRFDEEEKTWVSVESNEEFEAGQKYSLKGIEYNILSSVALNLSNAFDDLMDLEVVTNFKEDREKLTDLLSVNGKKTSDSKFGEFEKVIGKIKKIQVVTELPAAGKKVGDVFTCFGGEEANKVKFAKFDGKNEVKWSVKFTNSWAPLDDKDVFEEGKEYKITVGYTSNANYVDDTKTSFFVNGHKAEHDFTTLSYTFTCKPAITEINYNVKEPVAGDKANLTIKVETKPEGAFNKEFTEIDTTGAWEESTDGKNWAPMKGDVFVEGKYYRYDIADAYTTKLFNLRDQGYYIIDDEIASGFAEARKEYINGIDANTEEGKKYVDGYYLYFGPIKSATVVSPKTDKTNADKQKTDAPKTDVSKTDVPKVGSVVTDDKCTYKVTKEGKADGSVVGELEVTGLKNKTLKQIKIADTVKIDGVTYKVTSVAAKAFKGNKNVTKIIIGKNVKKIGANAFANCKKLKKVIIYSKVLKKVGKKAFFRKGGKKITFKVPKAKKKAYKKMLKKAKTKKFVVK